MLADLGAINDSWKHGTGPYILNGFYSFLLHPQTFQFIPNICRGTKLRSCWFTLPQSTLLASTVDWHFLPWAVALMWGYIRRQEKKNWQVRQRKDRLIRNFVLICVFLLTNTRKLCMERLSYALVSWHHKRCRNLFGIILYFSQCLSWSFRSARANWSCSHLSWRQNLLCVRKHKTPF